MASPSEASVPRRAVILDRDGTLLHDPGYLGDPRGVALLPDVGESLRALQAAGFLLVVASNQSGIARGKYTLAQYREVEQRVEAELAAERVRLTATYICPYHPDGVVPEYARDHEDRKPSPGMWLKAAADLHLDLARCYSIGDGERDVVAGKRAGTVAVLLAAERDKWPLPVGGPYDPDFTARDLREGVQWILNREGLPLLPSAHRRRDDVSAADKILTESRLKAIVAGHRRAGRRIVFTNGAFDLLHVGHVRALEEAATLGGVLVVAVNSDAGVRASKGVGRPVVPERERAEMVAALACVDHVTLFHDATVDRLLESLHPDVHAKGRDYTVDTVPERATAQRLGIETAIVGDPKEHSSSVLVARAGAAMVPLDRVVDVAAGDAHGLALRDARRLLAEEGWLDLRRLVEGTEGVRLGGSGGAFLRRVEIRGQPVFVKGTCPLDRARAPVKAFEDLLALRAAGFRTPEPCLALEGKVNGRRAGVLMTREARGLPLHEHLALALTTASPRERAAMARGLGVALKALHTARFMLPDLSAPHFLVDGSVAGGTRSLVFVNPRGLVRGGRRLKRRAAAAGLATLAASLREVTTRRFRLAVLRAYLAGSLKAARPWLDAIRKRLPRP